MMNVGDGLRMVEKRVGVTLIAEVWRETHSPCNHFQNNRLRPNGACVTNSRYVPSLESFSNRAENVT